MNRPTKTLTEQKEKKQRNRRKIRTATQYQRHHQQFHCEWNLWQKKLLRRIFAEKETATATATATKKNKINDKHICLLFIVVFSAGLFWEFFRISIPTQHNENFKCMANKWK